MSEELYRKIIDELVPLAPRQVCPFNDGEPLLDKNLVPRIAYLNRKLPEAKVILYTNASLLTPEKVKELAQLKISRISISFNAARKETYERVMVGLNYETVLRNIDALIDGFRGTDTEIMISFLKLDENRGESILFRKLWWGKPVEIGIWDRMDFGGHVRLPLGQRIRRAMDPLLPPIPCTRALNTMSILWDGRVAICCRDYEGEFLLGNVAESSVAATWNSEVAREARWKHLEGRRGQIGICRYCPGYDDRLRTPTKILKKALKRLAETAGRR
jgi:radical SAM protein with 4Fe4S-binding SPASM domain